MLRLKSWGNTFGTFYIGFYILRFSHLYVFRAKKQIKIVYAGQKHTRKVTHFCQSTQHFDEKKKLEFCLKSVSNTQQRYQFLLWENQKSRNTEHDYLRNLLKRYLNFHCEKIIELHIDNTRNGNKNFWENSRQFFCRVAIKYLVLVLK